MSAQILQEISSKIEALPGSRPEVAQTIASLWDRWYTTMGMRMGIKPETLYQSAGVDIQHVSTIAAEIGRELDLPDHLKSNPTLASLLDNEEVIDYLSQNLPKAPLHVNSNLMEWMQESKLVDGNGHPRTFYHGSFADFSHFDEAARNGTSRLGKAFYFSSDPNDASENYATPNSPELQAKAQAIFDTLRKSQFKFEDVSYDRIKERLAQDGGAVYPVHLRMNRPFTISPDTPYSRGTHDKAFPLGAIASSIVIDHKGSMVEARRLARQLNASTSTVDAINIVSDYAQSHGYEGLPLQIIQRAGYDGVIDRSAGALWHTPDTAEHFIVFEPGQIKSAVGNVGSYNDTSINILYQQAPEYDKVLYQFAGIKAANRNWTTLTQARKMQERGIEMDRIRKLTGWHQGIDDKWRFEIDDSQAMIDPNVFTPTNDYYERVAMRDFGIAGNFSGLPPREQKEITENYVPSSVFSGRLSQVLNHDLVFSHYPQMLDIPTEIQIHPDLPKASGTLHGTPPNAHLQIKAQNGAQALQVILHELQHGIQGIEEFAVGGQAKNFNQVSEETKRYYFKHLNDLRIVFDLADQRGIPISDAATMLGTRISETIANLAQQTSPKQLQDYAQKLEFEMRPSRTRYLYLAGEYEARQTVNRQNIPSERRNKIPLDSYEKVNTPLEIVFGNQQEPGGYMDYTPSGPLGAVIRNPMDSRFLMLLSENHNPSTLLHESCHIFLDEFIKQATLETAPGCLKEDYSKICQFVGAEPGQPFTTEQNERWAEACEQYFMDLDTSSSPAPKAMERMKSFMKETYQVSEEIGIDLTPEIKGVLDTMFDAQSLHSKIDFDELSEILNHQPPTSGINLNA